MAAMDKAGANAPATINGVEVNIDSEAAKSWAAFKIMRALNSDDVDSFAKMDAALQYAQLVSGLDEDGIVRVFELFKKNNQKQQCNRTKI